MPTLYHRRVQRAILEIGGASRKVRRVWNDRRPLHIVHPFRRTSLLYYPDARFETRSGKYWLFEVLDSETKSQAQMITHVIEPLLVEGVLGVVHIVKTDSELRVLEVVTDVILSRMTDLIGSKVDRRIRFFRVVISPDDAADTGTVKSVFSEGGIRF